MHLTYVLLLLQLPPNGLVVYTGMVMTEEGKEKKVRGRSSWSFPALRSSAADLNHTGVVKLPWSTMNGDMQ
jgi:hypothetical protein